MDELRLESYQTKDGRTYAVQSENREDLRKNIVNTLRGKGIDATFQTKGNQYINVLFKYSGDEHLGNLAIYKKGNPTMIGYIKLRITGNMAYIQGKGLKLYQGQGIMTTAESLLAEILKDQKVFTIKGEIKKGNSESIESRRNMRDVLDPSLYYLTSFQDHRDGGFAVKTSLLHTSKSPSERPVPKETKDRSIAVPSALEQLRPKS